MKRSAIFIGSAVLGLSTFTACGGSEESPAAAPSNTSSQAAPASSGAKLAAADVGNFGKIVVDGSSRTLYVFDKDTADPSKSTCDGDCAATWPPVVAGDGTPQLDGVDASLVGTVTRTDGSKQVTLAGLPLYRFASDSKPGEAKGQAVGGVWWVVGVDGKKITTEASGSGNDGY
ncbi:putative lipoprotein with Yx(FWY)xxD motif [Kribbella orskensis]|uniref:Lipoprotein with Yx(FWY)xxD motif n=1 Tax=Kribbella orskensis TaxID=2512216 RepID=A0ABY2BFX0_9ACTN|nr:MULTISPECIES: hypothetical protein [Kribbella]TCN37559.1 putative lipoprotein with Yx(FWY)xxD motif [Kribbella sp. VKM Ac-2500]TCO18939.1 putative lipoprotein with Yx(FWY)xxD motif [Kribbella orskensis]